MCDQLLITLVEAVDGQEERLGIGGVNRHGHLVRRGRLPHGVEARIVDLDELARRDVLAQTQAQDFEDFDAAGADFPCALISSACILE